MTRRSEGEETAVRMCQRRKGKNSNNHKKKWSLLRSFLYVIFIPSLSLCPSGPYTLGKQPYSTTSFHHRSTMILTGFLEE